MEGQKTNYSLIVNIASFCGRTNYKLGSMTEKPKLFFLILFDTSFPFKTR